MMVIIRPDLIRFLVFLQKRANKRGSKKTFFSFFNHSA